MIKKKDCKILWVDDDPNMNNQYVINAKKESIHIEQKVSTNEAIQYLQQNPAFKDLKSNEFRIITDRYRPEEEDDAAEAIIKWLRDNDWKTPVIIFCGDIQQSLPVSISYSFVCTTSDDEIFEYYINSMNTLNEYNNDVTVDDIVNKTKK